MQLGHCPRRKGVSCLFSVCHQILSRRLGFFNRKPFWVGWKNSWNFSYTILYWRRNLGTYSHVQELKSLMFQSVRKFSLMWLKSLTLEMRNKRISWDQGCCCEVGLLCWCILPSRPSWLWNFLELFRLHQVLDLPVTVTMLTAPRNWVSLRWTLWLFMRKLEVTKYIGEPQCLLQGQTWLRGVISCTQQH